jgi:prepilin-type N-terminal cleavage/methylation domain-containing protein
MNKKIAASADNNKGFSLVEILVAMLIFSVGISIIMKARRGVNDRMIDSKEISVISMLLDYKFKQIYAEYSKKNFDDLEKETTGSFTGEIDKYQTFTWKAEVVEMEFPDFMGLVATQQDTEKEGSRGDEKTETEGALQKIIAKNMTDHLKKSVRGLKVSVTGEGRTVTTSTFLVTFKEAMEFSL